MSVNNDDQRNGSAGGGVPLEPEGGPTDLESVLRAVHTRNTLLRRLASSVDGLAKQVRSLRRDIDDRPTKAQAEHRRRVSVLAMVIFGVMLVWGHDQHIQSCSPGANAQAVLQAFTKPQAFSDPRPRTPEESRALYASYLRSVFDAQPTERCDVTAPLSVHDPADDWPTRWNLLGFGVYGLLGGILWWWSRGPARSGESGRSREEEES